MGSMDRDYMHDRHRKPQARATGRLVGSAAKKGHWPMLRITYWTLVVCALIYLGTKYLVHHPSESPLFPASGQVFWYVPHETGVGAPLSVTAPVKGNAFYAVSLAEKTTGRLVGLIPLRKGETVEVQVPLGQYEMTFSSGSSWYGPEKQFGFWGDKKKALKTFDFYQSGNQTVGHTVDLTTRLDGNLKTRDVVPFEK